MRINNLTIVDGSYFLHRSLKVPEIYDLVHDGIRTGGVFQFLRLLSFELKDRGGLPLVVFDGGLSKRRLDVYPNYKRSEDKKDTAGKYESGVMSDSEKEEYEQSVEYLETYRFSRKYLIDLLGKLGIPTVIIKDVEGDDIIAVASRMDIVSKSVILTDDKDLIQLVNDNVELYRPMMKQSWDIDKLKEEFVSPHHYMMIKAIMGDGSDNIPQICKGVGIAKAKVLADEYYNNRGFIGIEEFLSNNMRYKWVQNLANTDYKTNLTNNIKLVDLISEDLPDKDLIESEVVKSIESSLSVKPSDIMISMELSKLGITEVDVAELVRIINMSRYNVSK